LIDETFFFFVELIYSFNPRLWLYSLEGNLTFANLLIIYSIRLAPPTRLNNNGVSDLADHRQTMDLMELDNEQACLEN
jgi:hypothetical protein